MHTVLSDCYNANKSSKKLIYITYWQWSNRACTLFKILATPYLYRSAAKAGLPTQIRIWLSATICAPTRYPDKELLQISKVHPCNGGQFQFLARLRCFAWLRWLAGSTIEISRMGTFYIRPRTGALHIVRTVSL